MRVLIICFYKHPYGLCGSTYFKATKLSSILDEKYVKGISTCEKLTQNMFLLRAVVVQFSQV